MQLALKGCEAAMMRFLPIGRRAMVDVYLQATALELEEGRVVTAELYRQRASELADRLRG